MSLVTVLSFAAIELIAPAQDSVIKLLPDCQCAVITNETRVRREAALNEVAPDGKAWQWHKGWRKARDVAFAWRATAGEHEPWEFSIAKKADFSDARIEFVGSKTNVEGTVTYVLPRANLEIATKYYWRVAAKRGQTSRAGSFVTEDLAPRWIAVEGRVGNFRDLGGRIGLGGRRIRQGMIYRSQGLNDNSVGGRRKGRNRLMVEDVDLYLKSCGITDAEIDTFRSIMLED